MTRNIVIMGHGTYNSAPLAGRIVGGALRSTTNPWPINLQAIVAGAGTIDLRDQGLDLELRTEPKRLPIGLLPPTINITGAFKHPAIRNSRAARTCRSRDRGRVCGRDWPREEAHTLAAGGRRFQ